MAQIVRVSTNIENGKQNVSLTWFKIFKTKSDSINWFTTSLRFDIRYVHKNNIS